MSTVPAKWRRALETFPIRTEEADNPETDLRRELDVRVTTEHAATSISPSTHTAYVYYGPGYLTLGPLVLSSISWVHT